MRNFIISNIRYTFNVNNKAVLDTTTQRNKLPYLITLTHYHKQQMFLFPNDNIIIVDVDSCDGRPLTQEQKKELSAQCCAYQLTNKGIHLIFVNDLKYFKSHTGLKSNKYKFDLRTSKKDGLPSTGVAFKGKIYYNNIKKAFSQSIFNDGVPKKRAFKATTRHTVTNINDSVALIWLKKNYPIYEYQNAELHTTTFKIMSNFTWRFGFNNIGVLKIFLELNTNNIAWPRWDAYFNEKINWLQKEKD